MELRRSGLFARKGVFFSLAAIIFLGILAIVISSSLQTQTVDTGLYSARSTSAIRERVESVYLPLVLRTTSAQSLHALTADAYSRNQWLSLPDDFSQAMENGTWGGAAAYPLASQTLPQALALLSNVSNTTGTNISFTVRNVTIVQVGSFVARAQATVNYTLRSTDGTVGYNRTVTIVADITLQGVQDLYYSERARTAGFASPYRIFHPQVPLRWNNTEFDRARVNGLYMLNNASPSVFNRLEGVVSASVYGVESLIDPAVATPMNTTALDWHYFENTQFGCTYAVTDPNLVVSYVTLTEYNLTNATNVQGLPTCPPSPIWP